MKFSISPEDIIRIVKSLLIPVSVGSVCPDVPLDPPTASLFLSNLQQNQLVLLVFGSIFTTVIIGIAVIQWLFVWRFVFEEKRQNMLYFLILVLPVSASCALIGMFVPRSAPMMTSVGILYYLICLVVLVALIWHLSGGRRNLVVYLNYRSRLINLQSAFCFFMWFLPELEPSEKNLQILEWMVLQGPVVRIIIVVSNMVALSEYRQDARYWFHWSEIGTITSTMIAIFGIHTLARLTSEKLQEFKFMRIFRVIDLALLIFSVQHLVIENTFVRFSIIECAPILTPSDSARFVCNFVITCEMLIFSLLVTYLVQPSNSSIFDNFKPNENGESGLSPTAHVLKWPKIVPLGDPMGETVVEQDAVLHEKQNEGNVPMILEEVTRNGKSRRGYVLLRNEPNVNIGDSSFEFPQMAMYRRWTVEMRRELQDDFTPTLTESVREVELGYSSYVPERVFERKEILVKSGAGKIPSMRVSRALIVLITSIVVCRPRRTLKMRSDGEIMRHLPTAYERLPMFDYFYSYMVVYPGVKVGLHVKSYNNKIFVVRCDQESLAEASFAIGDAILSIDDKPVTTIQDAVHAIAESLKAKKYVQAVVERAGSPQANAAVRQALFADKTVAMDPKMCADSIQIGQRFWREVEKGPEPKKGILRFLEPKRSVTRMTIATMAEECLIENEPVNPNLLFKVPPRPTAVTQNGGEMMDNSERWRTPKEDVPSGRQKAAQKQKECRDGSRSVRRKRKKEKSMEDSRSARRKKMEKSKEDRSKRDAILIRSKNEKSGLEAEKSSGDDMKHKKGKSKNRGAKEDADKERTQEEHDQKEKERLRNLTRKICLKRRDYKTKSDEERSTPFVGYNAYVPGYYNDLSYPLYGASYAYTVGSNKGAPRGPIRPAATSKLPNDQ
ncbi:hypothetical protein QR680_013476 [Steinernema hermaphroditum]|uniref:PDZ domain-containing protein n=1 Tax=Steinernema hermaphroditum TaxID=289476 RepID=A0AA39I5N1_9BILA|nr:hypothetical protein QR680_013476 [Steinernema hermaphroditum]